MARSFVQAGNRLACFLTATARETMRGLRRSSTQMSKENR